MEEGGDGDGGNGRILRMVVKMEERREQEGVTTCRLTGRRGDVRADRSGDRGERVTGVLEMNAMISKNTRTK